MKLLEFLKKIPQPDLNIKVYTVDHWLLAKDTLSKIILRLETNRNEDKYDLSYNDYNFTYADIKYLLFEDDIVFITLEDNLR